MPWCPNCKTEYNKGVNVCVDCGSELVSEQPLEYEYVTLSVIDKKEVADKLLKYFEYSKIDCHYEYSEKELGFEIFVRDEDFKKALKAFKAFYLVEAEQLTQQAVNAQDQEGLQEDNYHEAETQEKFKDEMQKDEILYNEELTDDELSNEALAFEDEYSEKRKVSKMMYSSGTYEKKADKSKEMKSTAVTFFSFGILGLVFVVLNLIGVLGIINATLPYVVMSALFLSFILIGFNSVERAKKAAIESLEEEKITKQITEWLDCTITENYLQSMKDPHLLEEANFIKIMEGMKELVTKQFGELDDAYLDYVTEEFYNSKFGA